MQRDEQLKSFLFSFLLVKAQLDIEQSMTQTLALLLYTAPAVIPHTSVKVDSLNGAGFPFLTLYALPLFNRRSQLSPYYNRLDSACSLIISDSSIALCFVELGALTESPSTGLLQPQLPSAPETLGTARRNDSSSATGCRCTAPPPGHTFGESASYTSMRNMRRSCREGPRVQRRRP